MSDNKRNLMIGLGVSGLLALGFGTAFVLRSMK